MNALFNTAFKQSTALKRDLLSPPSGQPIPPSFLGQVSASLATFSRTLDSYSELAKLELNPAKKEKADERIKNFRAELATFREELKELKLQNEGAQSSVNRTELLGRRPHNNSTPISDNPYANIETKNSNRNYAYSPQDLISPRTFGNEDQLREAHIMREHNFFAQTHSALDEYLIRGQSVLGDLSQQREMLKGTQKRLYSVANTLGISGETIRMVERRAKQDKWIFYSGVIIFLAFCWLVLHFLR